MRRRREGLFFGLCSLRPRAPSSVERRRRRLRHDSVRQPPACGRSYHHGRRRRPLGRRERWQRGRQRQEGRRLGEGAEGAPVQASDRAPEGLMDPARRLPGARRVRRRGGGPGNVGGGEGPRGDLWAVLPRGEDFFFLSRFFFRARGRPVFSGPKAMHVGAIALAVPFPQSPGEKGSRSSCKKKTVFFHPFFSPDRSLRNRTSPRSGRPTSSSAASS